MDRHRFGLMRMYYPDEEPTYSIRRIGNQVAFNGSLTNSRWQFVGDVDAFNLRAALTDLVNTIMSNINEGTFVQIRISSLRSDRIAMTNFLVKNQLIYNLFNILDLLIDYADFDINDIIYTVVKIRPPEGSGWKVNKIVDVRNKRSILSINNTDNLCLGRAIVTGLADSKTTNIVDIFKGKLTKEEIDEINYKRHNKSYTKINEGIITENEKKYIKNGQKLQEILTKALHRMCNIPLDKDNYGIIDIMDFEEKIQVNIALYSMESKIIYPGASYYENTIYILHDNDHFNVITNLNGFEAKDSYHNRNRNKKCKGCGAYEKCISEHVIFECPQCNKIFYNEKCLKNHKFNNYCLDHSYRCIECNRYFKTKNLKREKHRCNQYYCNNCEAYKVLDHECFMKKTKFKEVSEKYIFYDFESKKDIDNNHIVNFAIAHDMNGKKIYF